MENEGNMITDWLEQNGDPEIDRFLDKNLAITEKVRLAMEQKGWELQDLAKAMNVKPTDVSMWLTGMYNLSLKNIIKIEIALDINIF